MKKISIFVLMKTLNKAAMVLLLLPLLAACDKRDSMPDVSPDKYDNVVILYTAGYNNLSSDIRRNIQTVAGSPLPMKSSSKALILITHNAVKDTDFTTPVEPVIVRITSDWSGTAVLDTLKILSAQDNILDKNVMKSALTFVADNFKSEHYGIVFSSHGTGWLPEDYYRKPLTASRGMPKLKSFGACYEGSSSSLKASHELIVQDMAQTIPIHLDYIIFDACLMGGVEVAYELRKVTDKIGFSQAEVLSTGFDYTRFSECLLATSSPERFCQAYFEMYDKQSGSSRSATISFIDCSKLDALASLCNRMFERYRTQIAHVSPDKVQGFFTADKHWFYDLEDIFVQSGADQSDISAISSAINDCVIYKASTEKILGKFDVRTNCGLSSYLPANGNAKLNSFYRTLAWNQATGLVE